MTEQWDTSIDSMLVAITEVADGNLRARVPIAEDTPASLKSLAEGVNQIVLAWRESELRGRKTKRALEEKVAEAEAQAITISELSTPIMQIWSGTLLIPLVGRIDEKRSAEVTSGLLQEIVKTRSRRVIIDVTGVSEVDESTADNLLRLVRCTRLVGAQCSLTGINPKVAQTLANLGADLRGLKTLRTLEQALIDCINEISEMKTHV